MGRFGFWLAAAAVLSGCLDFDGAFDAFCASHGCVADGGAPEAAPETTLTAGPGAPPIGPDPSFQFTSNEADATFECQLQPTETAFTPCASPKAYSALVSLATPGYTFRVRARNGQGRVDPTPASFSLVPGPGVSITGSPGSGETTHSQQVSLQLSLSPEPGQVTLTCALDGQPRSDCAAGFTLSDLAAGVHTVTAQATDSFGNVGPVTTHSWTVTPLLTTIAGVRAGNTPVETLVTVGSGTSAVRVTARTTDRYWVQEGTSASMGITVQEPTPYSNPDLTPGYALSITGTVAQPAGNLTLSNASHTVVSRANAFYAYLTAADVGGLANLFSESYEGMFVYDPGQQSGCGTSGICVTNCAGTFSEPAVNAIAPVTTLIPLNPYRF